MALSVEGGNMIIECQLLNRNGNLEDLGQGGGQAFWERKKK